jgi:hypothetical protein
MGSCWSVLVGDSFVGSVALDDDGDNDVYFTFDLLLSSAGNAFRGLPLFLFTMVVSSSLANGWITVVFLGLPLLLFNGGGRSPLHMFSWYTSSADIFPVPKNNNYNKTTTKMIIITTNLLILVFSSLMSYHDMFFYRTALELVKVVQGYLPLPVLVVDSYKEMDSVQISSVKLCSDSMLSTI